MRRKTMRRTERMAQTVARRLREAGHTEVTVSRVTATDWAIVWTVRDRHAATNREDGTQ